MNMSVLFDLLRSISDERKIIGGDQNFVLILNMDLEILCLFLFKSSEKLFERLENLLLMFNVQFFVYAISPFQTC